MFKGYIHTHHNVQHHCDLDGVCVCSCFRRVPSLADWLVPVTQTSLNILSSRENRFIYFISFFLWTF